MGIINCGSADRVVVKALLHCGARLSQTSVPVLTRVLIPATAACDPPGARGTSPHHPEGLKGGLWPFFELSYPKG